DYGAGSTYVAGPVDIEALRHHRASAQWDNWLKDVRAELYRLLYERPIYPKNLYLKREPMKHAEYRQKVIKRQIRRPHDRGIGKRPGEGGRRVAPPGVRPPPPPRGVWPLIASPGPKQGNPPRVLSAAAPRAAFRLTPLGCLRASGAERPA